jgi:hypothetical protein
MFETFVIGPVGSKGLGLARRCVECRARGDIAQAKCTGFGVGCITGPEREAAALRGLAWAPLIDVELRLRGF